MLKLGNTEINALGNNINKAYLGAIEVFGNVFVSLWQTTTANETITLPTPTNYRVDWGDGTVTTNTNNHEYLTANQYTIKISGNINDFAFNNTGDKTKILDVSKYGGLNLYSGVFYGTLNMDVLAEDKPKILVSSLSNLYRDCASLLYSDDINLMDTSNVTTMESMFLGATIFNQNLNLDTSSVENMRFMFFKASSFNGSLTFDTSEVKNMESMFREANGFNQPLVFNTSKVTNMGFMFLTNLGFNNSLNFSDTSNVTIMREMFKESTSFNQPLNFNTSSVLNMFGMFLGATIFNNSLNFIDTSSVTNMGFMFRAAPSFNQPLNFNTSSVLNMDSTFNGATSFNQDISGWTFVSVNSMNGFMTGKGVEYDVNYMDSLYIKLDQDLVFANMVNINISFGTINYTSAGATARASLVSKGFIITSGIQV